MPEKYGISKNSLIASSIIISGISDIFTTISYLIRTYVCKDYGFHTMQAVAFYAILK